MSTLASRVSDVQGSQDMWETASQHQSGITVSSDGAATLTLDRGFYGTAASQRTGRLRKAPNRFPGLVSDISVIHDDDLDNVNLLLDESKLEPAATKNEGPSRKKSLKNTKPATLTKALSKGAPEKVRKNPAKQTVKKTSKVLPKRSLTAPTKAKQSTVSRPQPAKRKADTKALGTVPQPRCKKAKKSSAEPGNSNGLLQPCTTVEDDRHPRKQVTRRIPKPRRPSSAQEPASESMRDRPKPTKNSMLVKLKVTVTIGVEPKPMQSIPQNAECKESRPSAASQSSSFLLAQHTFSSFDSMDAMSAHRNQEQCAQIPPRQIASSSQAETSFNSSQTALPTSPPYGLGLPTPESQATSKMYNIDNVPKIRFEIPQHSSTHPPLSPTEADSLPSPPTRIDEITQPTLPWYPRTTTLAISGNDNNSDAGSDTTVDEVEEFRSQWISTKLSLTEHQLHDIVKRLFANRHSSTVRPAPAGQPEVWAEGRQELCETLHYFRSYQSACYSTGGFVRGFMFDNNGHSRDYIDEDVIISRAGGGMVKDKDSGEMKVGRDQSDDTSIVKALKNCMKQYNPVVVIIGANNPHVPSKPPHQYCVLDNFKPTHVWVEKSRGSKILRYRFEKLNTNKESWWRPAEGHDPIDLGSLDSPVENICTCCNEASQQIYLNGWMCLQPSCTAFWHIIHESSVESQEPDEASLVYDPRFLKQRTPWPNDNSESALVYDVPEISSYSIPGEDNSQAFWSGLVCPECGRCNSRLNWTGWACANPSCTFKKEPSHSIIPATALRDSFWPLSHSYTLSRDIVASFIDVGTTFAHGYRIVRYTIPGIEGFITHMIANKTVLEEAGGPDDMFEELQRHDIGLERRAMPNGQLKGESYCRHFAVNYGMPYKFIAATASQSFDGAARPITATRSRLNWAAQHLMTQESGNSMDEVSADWKKKEFNEVLALGYFESQKINYHDDGEHGLGPTIATLSLGAPGTMRLRMKARHYNGCSSAGVYDDSRPLPGCVQYEARTALRESLQALKQSNPQAYRARLKQIPKELKLRSSGNAKEALKMELGHGDIVVMHGAELQKYYEHAVEHAGKLRFALTCRYIDPESLKEGDKPGYEVGTDEGGYDGSKLC